MPKGLNWTEDEYQNWRRKQGENKVFGINDPLKPEKKSKYRVGNKSDRIYNGILFDSVKEMNYCKDLQLLQKAGELKFYLQQVPFDLPGGVKYRVDFVEFHEDGSVRFVDVKGIETPGFIMKKKQVEALYPVVIETV